MRVYVAAPWDHRDLARAFAARLEDRGITITRKWWDEEGGIPNAEIAALDYVAVKTADLLICLNTQKRGEETSGKAVETGFAIAHGVPVIVVGGWTNVFHFFPGVRIVEDTEAALAALEARS